MRCLMECRFPFVVIGHIWKIVQMLILIRDMAIILQGKVMCWMSLLRFSFWIVWGMK